MKKIHIQIGNNRHIQKIKNQIPVMWNKMKQRKIKFLFSTKQS